MAGLSSASARRIIELVIVGDSASAVRAIGEVATAADASTARMEKLGSAAGTVGRTALGLAAPLIGVGVVAGKMAMSFQASMEQIHTQAGASQQEVNKLSQSVLNLASSGAQQGPQQLAEGLFHIESIGLRGAKAMNVLKIASQGAAVGGADLTDTVTALGSAVAGGVRGAGNFSHAMGMMNAAVGAGDMHMQDLADAFGTQLLASMRTYGVSLKDTGAALAVFGDMNIRGAEAGTRLSQTLRVMAAPSNAAAKVMAGIGLSATQLGTDIRGPGGLLKALQDLASHLSSMSAPERARTLTQMFGGRQAGGVELLLSQLDRFQSKLQRVGEGSKKFASDVAAQQQTAAAKLHAAWAKVEAAMIRLGTTVLPIAAAAFTAIAAVVSPVLGLFTKLPAPIRDIIGGLIGFVAAAGVGLVVFEKLTKLWKAGQAILDFFRGTTLTAGAATTRAGEAATGALGPTTELTAANERLAASFDAVAASADVAATSIRAEGVAATTTGAETAAGATETGGAGLLSGLGGLGVGGAAALSLPILGPLALALWGPGDPHNRIGRHAARVLAARNKVRGPVGQTGRFEHGGLLPRHLDMGGDVFGPSVGTDSIPIMGSPGEFMLNQPAAQQIGPGALNYMNTTGRMPTPNITVEPPKVELWVDGRKLAEAVTRAVLRKAARGPSSLVGGSLATNVQGPAYTQP